MQTEIINGQQWEVFTPPRKRTTTGIVSVQTGGYIFLNLASYNLLGSPTYVKLLYSKQQNAIGIQATNEKPGATISQTKRSSTRVICARAFLSHYGIDTSKARRYLAQMKEDTLIVDLNHAVVVTRQPRQNKGANS